MNLDEFVLLLLVAALVVHLIMQLRSHRRVEHSIHDIHAMLTVWAETWPDPAVRAQLQKALKR